MPNYQTITSYLVGLGFEIDTRSERYFNDALKRGAIAVEKFSKGAVKDFALVGGTFVTTAAALTGATLDMMGGFAKQDLNFQLYARRMLMGTEAAKKMKIATDALGYSLEEIIWGPPELAERYRQLIADQTKMMEYLGGDRGEQAFRQIRDIQFQFTRMGPALQYFGMRLTEDILNKLSGSPQSLEERLKGFVDWFESPEGFVKISDKMATTIVPMLKAVGGLMERIFTVKHVEWVVNVVTNGADRLSKLYDWMTSDNRWSKLWDSDKSFSSNLSTFGDAFGLETSKTDIMGKAKREAEKYGLGPASVAEFLALLQQESNFNPNAQNARTGAFGLGQVMPNNWPLGKNGGSVDDQLAVAASIFFGNLKKRKGDAALALHDYYGWGKAGPGEPTFEQYLEQWQGKYNNWMKDPMITGGPEFQPNAYKVPDVTVNVTRTVASEEDIRRAVKSGVEEAQRNQSRLLTMQSQGTFV